MKLIGKNVLMKLAIIFFMLGLFLGLGNTVLPTVADAAISIEVKGDGVTVPTTFTQAQLEAMTQNQAHYSSINTWPTKKWYVAEGVKLADLLTAAGIKPEAKLIKVISTDGYNLTFTKKELVDDPRYYFPGLRENAEYDGSVPGSPVGKVQVDTIIALKSAGSDNFDSMTDSDAPLLVMGQRWVTEQTNNAFVKYVGKIEVSTANPGKWENPIANPPAGAVDAGTGVIFQPVNINDMDGANFHYTTDGSDPTFESPMYNWIKYRWWSSRQDVLANINHPIDVNDSMTIKAVAIGFGKTDSDIVTFNYQIPLVIKTGNPANATMNEVYAGHTFTAAGGAEPYSFAVTAGALPAGMVLNGAVMEGTPTASGTFVFTVTVTDSANPANTDSHEFTLVVNGAGVVAPPVLAADITNNRVGQAIDITFTDDAAWRAAISSINVDGTVLNSGQYAIGGGNINITGGVFAASGDYVITIQATGYSDAGVTQTIKAAASNPADFVVQNGALREYRGAGGDVIIPDNLGITSIESSSNVFQNRSSLTSISIPEGVTRIDNSTFYGCSGLISVIIPGSVTGIGQGAFDNCSSLISINIPEGVTSIEINAFSGCSSLSSISIPGSVASIEGSAFRNCSSLSSITIPDSVTSIGSGAFYGCSSLASIIIPVSVTSIGDGVFQNCSSLSSVSISQGVTSIGKNAFSGCSSLASIIIPVSVTSIGDGAFLNCSSLSSVSISEGVTSIGKNAFKDCSSLGSITIPASIASIGDGAFLNCSSLTAINVSSSNLNYASDGGVLFNNSKTIIVCYPAGKIGEYTVPDEVEGIGSSAFRGCINLTVVSIPVSVTSIGSSAFSGCSSLASIIIPGSVTGIGDNAFQNCSILSSVSILEGVTSIGGYAFNACSSLASISIPGSVTSIGDNAFKNCTNLSSVSILQGVTSIGGSAFSGCSSLALIIIPNSVTSFGNSAFSDCSSLNSISIPNSVTSIGNAAFSGCSSLASIIIPNSVTSIGNSAFRGCSSLASIIIPGNVTIIGDYSFQNCSILNSVSILGEVTSIGKYAFDGCGSLNSIIIPDTVTKIGDYAFQNCSSLTSIIIPGSVTSIGKYAFKNCSSLNSIIIPASVTSIGISAFSGCSNLTIYGYVDSYAASYAVSNGIPFIAITKGDVNGDDIINVLDVVRILNIALEKITPTAEESYASDVNGDCIINVLDVVRTVNIILGIA